MGNHDGENLKSEADILLRHSRPQRNSTWIPKTRDWRYATGVIQHDDFQDAPKARSVWDTLDYDYQASSDRNSQGGSLSRGSSGFGSDSSTDDTAVAVDTPMSTVLKVPSELLKLEVQKKAVHKPMCLREHVWVQVTKYTRIEQAAEEDGEPSYEVNGLFVRLHFTGKNKAQVQEILKRPVRLPLTKTPPERTQSSAANPNITPPVSSPNTPAASRTAETVRTPHILDSIESLYTFPLFQRTWVDETYSFNAKAVRSTLRAPDTIDVKELGDNYGWYADAVHIDAIFPPGVPLSAKEICAFYPHHVRWKGVMIRLTNNDYRGADIMGMQVHFRGAPDHHTPAVYMNNYQRDIVKNYIPGFKTATYKGKSDRNLRTNHLAPGPYLENMRKGFSLPTFDLLVQGLRHLPSGLDARNLTQCLLWYLGIRDSFTPKLDLNVLHTQSLIRALRQPLKPFGPQNLDRNALQEWRTKGRFDDFKVEDKKREHQQDHAVAGHQRRSQLHLNLDDDDVMMNLTIPIRHILIFPFLALHDFVGKALKLGIEKAERRQAARKKDDLKRGLEVKWIARAADNKDVDMYDEKQEDKMALVDVPAKPMVEEEVKKPYRIPKRPHPDEKELQPPSIPTCPKIPNGPHLLAPVPPRPTSSHSQYGGPTSRGWTYQHGGGNGYDAYGRQF